MGLLDILGGRDRNAQREPEEEAPAAAESTTSSSSREMLRDPAASLGGFEPPNRLYDPYADISTAMGGRRAAFQLPEGPEFVFQEEAAARRRGWTENLQFYTGIGYLGGGATGFAIGGYRYLNLPADQAFSTAKLKANRLINTSGSLGKRMACSSAILGLYFSTSESYIGYLADGRVPDEACTVAAGFFAAGLFRSVRGPKAAAIAGTVGAVAAGGLAAARQYFPSL
uniref:Mitochondrial import inner membrane translocase subunit TIM23 n=1 Tax=Tetradesmus obliquus TaxID=3088 RepID=A0A383W565_TETOB|eukprot:jgi/Sobl393_1/4443/SZX72611.1